MHQKGPQILNRLWKKEGSKKAAKRGRDPLKEGPKETGSDY